MRVYGVQVKENPHYASYEDDCWVILAKEIMTGYANSYTNTTPIYAKSQVEYDEIDRRSCIPVRRSILRNIKHGPLKNAINLESVYSGLEARRMQYKASLGIRWTENNSIDLENL